MKKVTLKKRVDVLRSVLDSLIVELHDRRNIGICDKIVLRGKLKDI